MYVTLMNDKMKTKYVFSLSFVSLKKHIYLAIKKNIVILNTHPVFKRRCCLT